ncbi:MAG: choice-of-anchor Q domain-containing protein [Planctomycetota bacterium]|jgi:hypothetical protein
MLSLSGNPSLTSCWFSGNSTCLLGGGFYCRGGDAVVVDCAFLGNSSTSLALGGGMANELGTATLRSCLFVGNQAVSGGGMYTRDGNSILDNCTFAENSATNGEAAACDTTTEPSSIEIANSILWDGRDELWNGGGSTITVAYSDVQGGWPGTGCMNADPDFVRSPDPGLDGTWGTGDDDYGNLHLLPGSPCINAGDPAYVPPPDETDLDGHARLLCERVDLGAYEFGIGDFDCNQTVDLLDLIGWPSCMTGPGLGPYGSGCAAFDFEFDGDVDTQDFAGFQAVLAGPSP